MNSKNSLKTSIGYGFFFGLLGLLLMYFSIQATDTVRVDLRHLAILFIGFYGGIPATIVTTVIIAGSRFFFGFTEAAYVAVALSLLLGGCVILLAKYAQIDSIKVKMFFGNIIGMLFVTIALYITISDEALRQEILLFYWPFGIIAGLLAVKVFIDMQEANRLFHFYKESAEVDFLTGLNNVRQFDYYLNIFTTRFKEKHESLSILVIDIDHFKKVNDTYGHDAGDEVLKQLGAILNETSRDMDIVSRNGGEEFSILLPNCRLTQATAVGERIRKRVENNTFVLPDNQPLHITVSIGASSLTKQDVVIKDFLKRADVALYEAKESGRNKLCIAQ
ncbi:GGDEF domain-containing protein [Thalassobacillus hwangdonensis]|uniref:GGDEF domain-containing protein n=1 Tax=Thalassobacillus hwangdonensis TaxID=546108 RepID=A0ABW3L4M3_9BACI